MCGIVGYIGNNNAKDVLLEGLKRLEYRGYDSAGIAVRCDSSLVEIVKSEGKIDNLVKKVSSLNINGTKGIGHSRWSTHGKPSEINAHPHHSDDYNVVGVHNGIIENYQELKEKLLRHDYSFYSETDTEVLIKLIDYYYKKYNIGPVDAINKAIVRSRGSFALALMFKDYPDQIWFAKKGSPLIIAKGEGESFLASDVPALLSYTNKVYYVDDFECGSISKNEIKFYDLNGDDITDTKKLVSIDWEADSVNKGIYPYYMIKEIHEQPEAIKETINAYLDKNNNIDFLHIGISEKYLKSLDEIYIYACGSAYHVGLVGAQIIENITGINARVELASEFKYRNYHMNPNALAIIISQSGETKDTYEALLKCKESNIKTLAICNVKGSTITRDADFTALTYAGPEIAVATTKAYSCQLVVLYLFSIALAFSKGQIDISRYKSLIEDICTIPNKIENILNNESTIQSLAQRLVNKKDVFFIGRGIDYALSMEASLKLKEISYIHSDSYAAGELKHGTLSLIDESVMVIAILTQPDLFEKMVSNIVEVKSRGGKVISLTTDNFNIQVKSDYNITIPTINPLVTPSLSIIPLQLLAYYTSIGKGIDPDKPKNLAKSVTVE